jgi:hypothetical protein
MAVGEQKFRIREDALRLWVRISQYLSHRWNGKGQSHNLITPDDPIHGITICYCCNFMTELILLKDKMIHQENIRW